MHNAEVVSELSPDLLQWATITLAHEWACFLIRATP